MSEKQLLTESPLESADTEKIEDTSTEETEETEENEDA